MTDFVIDLPGGTIDFRRRVILRQGRAITVEPRVWRVLEVLTRFRHRVVSKQELLRALRADGGATDGALKQVIRLARLAIGDDGAVIRSIPRVGYRFEPGTGGGIAASEAPAPREAPLRILITPLHDLTGRPKLQWAGIGLMACIAHGLSADRRLLLMHDPQCMGLDMVLPRNAREFEHALRATGADWVIAGTLTHRHPGLVLEIQMQAADRHAVVSVGGDTAASLIAPAIEAVHHEILPAPEAETFDGGMGQHTLVAIETFARAMHAAAQNRDTAALQLLQLLERFDPAFPRLELELLRAHAACGSSEGGEVAQRLLARAHDTRDTVLESQTLLAAGRLCAMGGRFREAEQHLRDALRVGESTMAADWVGQVLVLLSSTLCHLGETDAVDEHLANAHMICAATRNRFLSLNILWLSAALSSQAGDLERSIRWHKRLAATARSLRASHALTAACINLAGDHIQLYQLDKANRFAEEATAAALAMENIVYRALAANVHCLLLRLQDRPGAAAALLSQLPAPSEDDGEGHLWQAHGHAASAAGRLDDAADCFAMAAQVYRRQRNCIGEVHLVPWLIEALVRSGRLDEADAELAQASGQAHLQDAWTTAHLLYGRALLAKARHQHAQCWELLSRLEESTAAKPLFRELGRRLARAPRQEPYGTASAPARHSVLRQEYRLGPYLIDLDRRILWVNGRQRRLAPMPFAVLTYLFVNSTRVVSQSELLSALWPEEGGSPETLAQAIASIRRAARTDGSSAQLIETVYGRGYRLIPPSKAKPAAKDEVAHSFIQFASGPKLPDLIVIPASATLPGEALDAAPFDHVLLLGQATAFHANMSLLSPERVRAALQEPSAADADQAFAALRQRFPSTCIVEVGMTRHGGHVRLEYSASGVQDRVIRGTLQHRSITALGRALALHLLETLGTTDTSGGGALPPDPWTLHWLERAGRCIEQGNWPSALTMLEAVTKEDPTSEHAAALYELATRAVEASAARSAVHPAQANGSAHDTRKPPSARSAGS